MRYLGVEKIWLVVLVLALLAGAGVYRFSVLPEVYPAGTSEYILKPQVQRVIPSFTHFKGLQPTINGNTLQGSSPSLQAPLTASFEPQGVNCVPLSDGQATCNITTDVTLSQF